MADIIKEIITDEEKLRDRCSEFDFKRDAKDIRKINLEMKNVIKENGIVGLSANQIGYSKRLVVLKFGETLKAYINPAITGFDSQKLVLNRETCSSIPDKTYLIPRFDEIQVCYMTPLGKIEAQKMVGVAARKMQHCIDHIDGVLVSDIGLEVDDDFFNATDEEQGEIIKQYCEALDLAQKSVKEEIDSDEDLTKMNNAINFMKEVQKGEVAVEPVTVTIKNDDGEEISTKRLKRTKRNNQDKKKKEQ